ncbi:hypothetical protein HDU97_000617 [Phlyctochytrium planicorne]|nr:hypothetical protein HDU97_000617 [Phlyctochytrium planicorne]
MKGFLRIWKTPSPQDRTSEILAFKVNLVFAINTRALWNCVGYLLIFRSPSIGIFFTSLLSTQTYNLFEKLLLGIMYWRTQKQKQKRIDLENAEKMKDQGVPEIRQLKQDVVDEKLQAITDVLLAGTGRDVPALLAPKLSPYAGKVKILSATNLQGSTPSLNSTVSSQSTQKDNDFAAIVAFAQPSSTAKSPSVIGGSTAPSLRTGRGSKPSSIANGSRTHVNVGAIYANSRNGKFKSLSESRESGVDSELDGNNDGLPLPPLGLSAISQSNQKIDLVLPHDEIFVAVIEHHVSTEAEKIEPADGPDATKIEEDTVESSIFDSQSEVKGHDPFTPVSEKVAYGFYRIGQMSADYAALLTAIFIVLIASAVGDPRNWSYHYYSVDPVNLLVIRLCSAIIICLFFDMLSITMESRLIGFDAAACMAELLEAKLSIASYWYFCWNLACTLACFLLADTGLWFGSPTYNDMRRY